MNVEMRELISTVADVLVAIAAAGGLVVAIIGLHTWRSEMKGRTEYELARKTLKSCFKVRDQFWKVRNPLGSIPVELLGKTDELRQHTIKQFQDRLDG